MRRLGIVAVGLALVVSLAFGAGAFALFVWPGGEDSETPATISKDEPVLTRATVQDIVTGRLTADQRVRVSDIEAEYLGNDRWQVRLTYYGYGSEVTVFSAMFEYNEQTRRLTAENAIAERLIGD